MALTTVSRVKQILDTELTDENIEAYIGSAHVMLNSAFVGVSINSDLRLELETWVTAHMIASTREQQLSEASAGSAKAKFQGQTGLGLNSTFYGQVAKNMDTTGTLLRLDGKIASLTSIKSE